MLRYTSPRPHAAPAGWARTAPDGLSEARAEARSVTWADSWAARWWAASASARAVASRRSRSAMSRAAASRSRSADLSSSAMVRRAPRRSAGRVLGGPPRRSCAVRRAEPVDLLARRRPGSGRPAAASRQRRRDPAQRPGAAGRPPRSPAEPPLRPAGPVGVAAGDGELLLGGHGVPLGLVGVAAGRGRVLPGGVELLAYRRGLCSCRVAVGLGLRAQGGRRAGLPLGLVLARRGPAGVRGGGFRGALGGFGEPAGLVALGGRGGGQLVGGVRAAVIACSASRRASSRSVCAAATWREASARTSATCRSTPAGDISECRASVRVPTSWSRRSTASQVRATSPARPGEERCRIRTLRDARWHSPSLSRQ